MKDAGPNEDAYGAEIAGATGRILVVDDEESMRHFVSRGLRRRGHTVRAASSADEALQVLGEEAFDLVLLDLKMPGRSGMDALRDILRLPDAPRVVMMTGYGTIETAVEAIKTGAADYITKPLHLEDLGRAAAREVETVRLARENRSLREALARKASAPLLGLSPAMHTLRGEIEKVAGGTSTVLLLGESGTGKEVAARAIHDGSPRSGGPFVAVNCGALPENLLESELFGYHPGAFTGAVKRKTGVFERADKGTLFLDEIGELPANFQVVLLRVLQEKEVLPLGGPGPVRVDFRLVVASNRDLEADVMEGRFREDLFYRVNVISIRLPRLSGRPGDPTMLARHFLRRFAGPDVEFDPEVFALFEAYAWPGNVRELMNVVERCAALASGRRIGVEALPEPLKERAGKAEAPPPMKEARLAFETDYLERLLAASEGNVSKAARTAGISRPSLHGRIKELGLDPSSFKKKKP